MLNSFARSHSQAACNTVGQFQFLEQTHFKKERGDGVEVIS